MAGKTHRTAYFKNITAITIAVVLSIPAFRQAHAWGSWGHQHINNAAVFTLPKEMRSFFYNHTDFVTEEAVVPDLRKFINGDRGEGPKHFIDLEEYNYTDAAAMAQSMKEAKEKYEDKRLQKSGSLPWQIEELYAKLVDAFKEKSKTKILYIAGDIAHYIGDATQPLHTTSNYDGQQTNQKGIHSFFESQLPEQFGDSYNFNTGDVHYIKNINTETWRIIAQSHSLVDTLLQAERTAKENFKAEEYKKDAQGNVLKNRYGQWIRSKSFARKYHTELHGMIERQLRTAVNETASFWYSAWVDAGKPDLSDLDPSDITDRNRKNLDADYKSFEKGKLTGFTTDP
jgi:hypothetical protein